MLKKGQNEGIDWEDVKQRLHESQAALEKALTDDPKRVETEFRQRAAQLASRGGQTAAAATLRVLVFSLGAERYALPFADLAELLPFTGCIPVPAGPPQLLGVANIHGEIRSVLDLGRLLDLPESEPIASGYVMLVRKKGREVALRVDHLDKIQFLPATDLAAPAAEGGPSFRYLEALTPDGLRLLNTEAVLTQAQGARGQSSG